MKKQKWRENKKNKIHIQIDKKEKKKNASTHVAQRHTRSRVGSEPSGSCKAW